MKTIIILLIILLTPGAVYPQMILELPNGEQRLRYEFCDKHHNCRIVERTVNYFICDEHHNCRLIDAAETGTVKLWEEEELLRSGKFVFSTPLS